MQPQPELIGRAGPLAMLRTALARMQDGHGGLLLIRGEAGIGKSALLARAGSEAASSGARVVSGRAWELAEAPPYFPLWPALRDLGLSTPGAQTGDAFELWERVLAQLALACASEPRVWLLEDIHAADLLSLDLLTFLAGPLRALRALVVVTARAQDPRLTERAQQRFTRLLREGQEIALEPLSAAQVAELTLQITQRDLPPLALARLCELTAGNPLFVVECARASRSSGSAQPRLPQTVRQVILERVALLPEATRRTLAACAVLGREVAAASVARVLEVLPAKVIDDLLPALQAGTLRELRPGSFSFSHILVRDAIEDSLAAAERSQLHAGAERALAALGDSPEVLVERARHALASPEPDSAGIALAQRAAALLEELGAFDRAYAMQQRIADARTHALAQPLTGREQLQLARLAQAAGRHQEGRGLCRQVLLRARAAQDAELLALAALALGSELRPGAVDRELVSELERARTALEGAAAADNAPEPAASAALECRVLARLAAALQPAQDYSVPVALALSAIQRARGLGDDELLIETLHVAGSALVDAAPLEQCRQTHEELLALALQRSDLARAASALARLAMDQVEHGHFSAWEGYVARALELAPRLHPRHRWRTLLLGSMRAIARGEVLESERLLLEVRELAALTDDPALGLSLTAHAAQRALFLHLDSEAHACGEIDLHLDDVAMGGVVPRLLEASTFARLEVPERVGRALGGLPALDPNAPVCWRAWAAEGYAFIADLPKCRQLRDFFAARAHLQVVGGHVPFTYEGPVLRVLGILDSALSEHASAERLLRSALEEVEAHGLRTWVAQLHYDLARALQRARREREAEPLFARAAELAQQIGMPGLALRATERAQSSGRVNAPASVTPARAPLGMFKEGDVWRITQGTKLVRVKATRGLQLLARLVERPGEDLHVLALASDDAGASLHDTRVAGFDVPDAQARRDYKQRLDALVGELEEAEQTGNLGRAESIRNEREALATELARAFGVGGTARPSGSPAERARVNVQRRLKDAIARIGEADPELGGYLEKAVVTGTYCRFLA